MQEQVQEASVLREARLDLLRAKMNPGRTEAGRARRRRYTRISVVHSITMSGGAVTIAPGMDALRSRNVKMCLRHTAIPFEPTGKARTVWNTTMVLPDRSGCRGG